MTSANYLPVLGYRAACSPANTTALEFLSVTNTSWHMRNICIQIQPFGKSPSIICTRVVTLENSGVTKVGLIR
jgi:hypothetical protein